MQRTDVLVIGGGIVGLATAYTIGRRFPSLRVVVLEKEAELAHHQSGHNSGVLHTGIYYRPGSLRARNCRSGKAAMEQFCRTEGIDFEICGKVIVAVSESELPALERIHERGVANGVRCELIDRARLGELEPHAAGVRALHVPEAGIISYRQVCRRLAERKIDIDLTDAAIEHFARAGYDPVYGARPLKRVIQRRLQDTLAMALLSGVSLMVREFSAGFSAIWRDWRSDRSRVTTCFGSPLDR